MRRARNQCAIARKTARSICQRLKRNRFKKFLPLYAAGFALLSVGANLCAAPVTWIPGTALTEPRSSAATVVSPSGSILVFGGSPIDSTDVLVYGGNTVQPLTSTRIAPGAVALSSSQFFVYGGKRTNTASSVTSGALSYNPVPSGLDDPNVFTVASMSTARYDLAYARDAAGYAYAIGGLGNNNALLASVERYNSVSNLWANVAALPAGRYHFNAVFDGTNIIYTFGGRTNVTAGMETATVLSYDVSGNVWSTLAPMPVATAGSAAIKGADGKFYVIGGTADGVVTNLVQVYDPASNSWQLSTPLPAAVTATAGAADAFGHLVVLGGADASGADLTTTWVSQQLNQPDTAPVFMTSVLPKATYQIPYTYTVTASGNPQSTYQLLTAPVGMQIDPYTGELIWTPQADQMGSNVVTIQAGNYSGTTNRTFTINAVGPTPDTPANVSVTDLGENSVTLAWDSVSPVVASMTYQIYYRHVVYAGKGTTRVVYTLLLSNITSPSVAIGGLATGSSHTYAVVAVAAGSVSALSQNITITTLSPQAPTNLHVTGLTFTSIALAWDPSPGPVPIASYEVWGWIDNGVTSAVYGTGITNTTVTITGLVPGSTHEWGVRAHDAEGNASGFDYGPTVVNPAPTPALLSYGASSPGGGFQFTVQASAIQTTLIQATTNLADPASWTTIGTILPDNSTLSFRDTNASQFELRFYRVINP